MQNTFYCMLVDKCMGQIIKFALLKTKYNLQKLNNALVFLQTQFH